MVLSWGLGLGMDSDLCTTSTGLLSLACSLPMLHPVPSLLPTTGDGDDRKPWKGSKYVPLLLFLMSKIKHGELLNKSSGRCKQEVDQAVGQTVSQTDQKSHRNFPRFSYHFSPFSRHSWIFAWPSVYINDSSIQFSSVAQSCPTLCDPMDCNTPGFPVHHQLPSLFELMSIESVMPSNYLILCHSLLLPPSIFPSIWFFSNESVLRIRGPKY